MLAACLMLIGFDLLGEAIRTYLAVPFPGSLIGLFLLTSLLLLRPQLLQSRAAEFARFSTSQMALFFIPAGCGVIAKASEIRANWLPITAALIISTIVSLFATAWVMRAIHNVCQRFRQENQVGTRC